MEKHINNNGYDYVDLCLPSGALWATMNVGADKPSDCGLYFQWGDTVGYTKEQVGKEKLFNSGDYKLNPSGDGKTFTKYKTTGEVLALEDDAAHIHMGGDWHIPSPEQIQELIDNTEASFITSNYGISGMVLTSKKDVSKSIFFPFAGYALDDSIDWAGDYGGIWASMISMNGINYGKYFYFYSEGAYPDECSRYYGVSVRGIICK